MSRHNTTGQRGNPTLSSAIKEAREDAGMGQRELADLLGVSQSMLGRWETTTEPRLNVIWQIELALDMPQGTLLRRAGFIDWGLVSTVRAAIEADPALDERARRVLLGTYRQLIQDARD